MESSKRTKQESPSLDIDVIQRAIVRAREERSAAFALLLDRAGTRVAAVLRAAGRALREWLVLVGSRLTGKGLRFR